MPNHEVPLDVHIAAVRKSAQEWGFSEQMVRNLVIEVRQNTPRTWPFAMSLAATEMLLLAIYLKKESIKDREQAAGP